MSDALVPGGYSVSIGGGVTHREINIYSGYSSESNYYGSSCNELVVNGYLNLTNCTINEFGSGNYAGGIYVNSGKELNIYNDVIFNDQETAIQTASHNVTIDSNDPLEINNCNTGIIILNSSPYLDNVIMNSVNMGIGVLGSLSNPTFYHVTVGSGSSYGMTFFFDADATLSHSNLESITGHRIDMNGTGIVLALGGNNNNFTFNADNPNDIKYAIRNFNNLIYVYDNFMGSTNPSCPVANVINNPNYVYDWNNRSLSRYTNNGAPKIAAIQQTGNSLVVANEMELSGDIDEALELYRNIIYTSDTPTFRRKAIKSIMKINEQNELPYGEIRRIIENELNSVEEWEYPESKYLWYRPSLDFLLIELSVLESKQIKNESEKECLLLKAANDFDRMSMQYSGDPMEVEMLARAANIYGDMLNDTQTAKQYADRAAQINPGQEILVSAYRSARTDYNPRAHEDIYAFNDLKKFSPPPIPEPEATEEIIDSITISPNPFNPSTVIGYTLTNPTQVELSIYSITGQKVATLVNDHVPAGRHSVTFDGANLASGIYFYRFESDALNKTGKLMLMK